MQVPNSSSVSEFLLLAFTDTRELQLLHFGLFLGIYLAALLGNGLILTAVACDHRLHTPMYFFLLNLALLDLGWTKTSGLLGPSILPTPSALSFAVFPILSQTLPYFLEDCRHPSLFTSWHFHHFTNVSSNLTTSPIDPLNTKPWSYHVHSLGDLLHHSTTL
uniref:G-protein coupled receptors family 1 profile domain-containing protein n=1 Tax=Anser brachyrhynchus TaxID=132585 RepID=A0A8B9CZ94_9AVES